MRITISPDENPLNDPGSVHHSGVTERSVNLRVAWALYDALKRCGQDPQFDPNITFVERVARANSDGSMLLVACAHNSSLPQTASGTQFVFCYPDGESFGRQAALADSVYAELRQIPGWPSRRGNAVENIYECCAFNLDTLYTEYLFMTDADMVFWDRIDYGRTAAEATARGIAQVMGFAYVQREPVVVPIVHRRNDMANPIALMRTDGKVDEFDLMNDGTIVHTVWMDAVPVNRDPLPGRWDAIMARGTMWDQHEQVLRLVGIDSALHQLYECVWSYADPQWVLNNTPIL